MRKARFLAPAWEAGRRSGIYHCVSRVVDRQFVLGKEEKERFVQLMRLYERFCGVRVLSHCVMSNHFHLLVEVPLRPEEGLSEREFFGRLSLLYSEMHVAEVRRLIRERKRAGDEEGVQAIVEKYLYRMWNLSEFMKTLKQRFTQWFNKKHGRRGTLWEDRFKSVIVQDGYAARVLTAYIDLNPVRAGIVKDPGKYRWCSYAEAVAGGTEARNGIERVMSEYENLGGGVRKAKSWRQVIADYRVILFSDGQERVRDSERTQKVEVARRGVSPRQAAKVLQAGGKLSLAELLEHKVRYFVDGGVIGSRSFVDGVFNEARNRFGRTRKNGAHPMRGCEGPLFSLRDLRVRAIE
ncbi:MAG: transposase [Roseibacillus sp.]